MQVWDIKEKRSETGSLLSMTLEEGFDNPRTFGPVSLVRQLHVHRSPDDRWSFELTGPRGGPKGGAQFSKAALRAFFTRLRVEIE